MAKTTAPVSVPFPPAEKPHQETTSAPVAQKRKAEDEARYPSPDSGDLNGQAPAAKKRKKAATSSEKKPRKAPAKTQKAPTTQSPKTRTKRKTKGEQDASINAAPALPPTKITEAVANKVLQVKKFIAQTNEADTKLERDADNKSLVTIPQHILQGALMSMRVHYQLGSQHAASIADVEEAIVSRSSRLIGESKHDVDWITLDISKPTKFERSIKEKIARHGLDDTRLLEIELELTTRNELRWAGVLVEDEIRCDAERLVKTFRKIWAGIREAEEGADTALSNPKKAKVGKKVDMGRGKEDC